MISRVYKMKSDKIFRNTVTLGQIRYFYTKNNRLEESFSRSLLFRNDLQHFNCQDSLQSKRKYTMEVNKKETFLIAGLGNHDLPGTRHSVGMQFINRLAQFLDINLSKNRDCVGFVGEKELRHINLVLLKPKQPMNINGTSVYKTAKKHKVPVSNIFIVHDDIQKKVGKVTVKQDGSALGHNGVKSVIQSFKTDAILRVRIGIDRPASVDMMCDYVLAKFKTEEGDKISEAINQGIVKVAKHIGSIVGKPAAEIFLTIEDSEDCDDSSKSNNSDKDNDVT